MDGFREMAPKYDVTELEVAVPLPGILRILGWSRRKFFYRRNELLDCGAVFMLNHGRPPRKMYFAFPTALRRWMGLKGIRREPI